MKTLLRYGTRLRATRMILGFAGLASLAMLCAEPTRAQSKPERAETAATSSSPASDASLRSPSSGEKFTSTQAVSQKSSAQSVASKGQQEGITVHGRWVIDVKNPDGKVVTHREFENAIQPFGMAYLAALLGGNNSSGGLSILLNGANAFFEGPNSQTPIGFTTDVGPCLPMNGNSRSGGVATGTTCLITTGTSFLGEICLTAQAQNGALSLPGPCSTNLATTAPTFLITSNNTSLSGQLTLSGSVVVSSQLSGNVTNVETVFATCAATVSPANCLNYFNPQNQTLPPGSALPVAIDVFTMRPLDGNNGDPAPVPYSSGQTISVTVTISFQ